MSQREKAVSVRTVGIDTVKNTFHLIGLDEQGTIVLREKLARRDCQAASECIALLDRDSSVATHYVAASCSRSVVM
jgi:hypothetical protein